jgi:pSer/pThr/pTyr-binding forkhead associated (FHA) protein
MARLVVRANAGDERVVELKMGINRLGRHSDNDIQIDHPTVSSTHCELSVENGVLVIRDCDSTNGTFYLGEPVTELRLGVGETFRAGDVEVYVDNTDMNVLIPQFELPKPKAPPVVKRDGALFCPRHEEAPATHQCTHCREVMCEGCVTRMKRRGGNVLKLCPLCSHKVAMIGAGKKKKKTFLGMLQQTVKLPFLTGKRH